MLRVTTNKGIWHKVNTLHCIYRVDNMNLNKNCLNVQFYIYYLLEKNNPLEGKTGAWIYTTINLTVAYPYTNCSEVGDMIWRFSDDVGIPDILRSDLATETTEKNIHSLKLKKSVYVLNWHNQKQNGPNRITCRKVSLGIWRRVFDKILCPRKSLSVLGIMN